MLCDKTLNIAKNPKYEGYHDGLVSMINKCFDKKACGGTVKNEIMSNKGLDEELHKQNIRKFGKRKVHSIFYKQYLECRSCRYSNDKKM